MSQYTNIRLRIRRAWADLAGKPDPSVMAAYRLGVTAGEQFERIRLGYEGATQLDQPGGRHLHLA